MSAGTDALKAAWRNFQSDGIPASGANEPSKTEIRAGLDALAVDIAAAAVGDLGEAIALLQPMVDDAEAAATTAAATVEEIYGGAVNLATSLEAGYIDKTTGAAAVQAGWRRTVNFIPVSPDHYFYSDNATPVAESSPTGCNLAFYDAAQGFLGYANIIPDGYVHAGSVSDNVAFMRAANPATTSFNIFAKRYIPPASVDGLTDLMGQFEIVDWFTAAGVSQGYIARDTGVLITSAGWRATDFIAVEPGMVVTYTGTGNGTLVASVAVYDADQSFLEYVLASSAPAEGASFTLANPATAYVRASAQASPAHSFYAGMSLREDSLARAFSVPPSYFAATEGYALKGERMTMYARGICADRAFDLAWNLPESNERLATILEANAGTVTVELEATDRLSAPNKIVSFPVHVSGTPVNPAAMRNFIHLGDSTVEGTARAGIQGAMANEISRRLNGTGTALLSGAQSPAALALTNTRFLGTLGDQPVKHEGRGGWRAAQYVQLANVGAVTNAFWNPGTSEFDLAYYLSQNGFDSGSLAGGVNSTGSNLTIILQLGWNDVYSGSPGESKADMAALIDAIHTTHPATDIIVTGLTPGHPINIKTFSGSRFVSERRIFEDAVRGFGEAYRSLGDDKPNTSFLQTSHVFDPELGYDLTTKPLSIRSAETLTGAIDHVHPNALGYAMLADALFYKIIHEYCQ